MGQCWVAALAGYNFQLHYKTGKSNVKADVLSQIPWQQAGLEYIDLDCQTVEVIIMGCTTETSLFEAYLGKTIQAEGFQMISPQTDTLFLGNVEVDQNPPFTNHEWREQQSEDKTILEIRDLFQSKQLSQ